MNYAPLIKAFGRATVCYLQPVPFQRKKFFSRLLRNTMFAVIAQQSLHAGLGNLLYPSIEEKFIELGIEKEVVEQMELPPFAFVRPAPQDRSLIDHLYSMTDVPTLAGLFLSNDSLSSHTHGKTLPYPACDIMLPDSEGLVKSWVVNASLLPEEKIIPAVNGHDALALILAHEIGHCDWQEHIRAFAANAHIAFMEGTLSTLISREIRRAEFHSDLSAMEFARNMKNPDKAEAMMDFLIASRNASQYYIWNANTGYAYDYGPSLDAVRRNEEPHSLAEFQSSRKELAEYISKNLSYQTLEDYTSALVSTLEKFVEEHKESALPLSIKRAESFVSAIQYFAPDTAMTTAVAEIPEEQLPIPELSH